MKKTAQKKESPQSSVKLRPCAVCEADSTGYHFGVMSCEACKSFFRRSLKRQADMVCANEGNCNIKYGEVKGTPCPACRVTRCLAVGMSLDAVKKGRYTLERRAETIMESRKYWKSKTDSNAPASETPPPTMSPTTSNSDVIAKILFASNSQDQSEFQNNISDSQPSQLLRPAKRSSHSFSSTSSSFDSDSGLQLQDDMLSADSMLSLLTNNDPIMLESETAIAMDIPEANNQPLNDVFMSKSMYTCKGTDNHTLKSLLATPSSPYYQMAVPDTTTADSESLVRDSDTLIPDLHEFHPTEDTISDAAVMSNIETQLLNNNVSEPTPDTENMSQILGNFSDNVPSTLTNGDPPMGSVVPEQSSELLGQDVHSQSVLDKLLGLKTLFKDPNNTTEFKTDYLKGFNTEKQDCDSIQTLFNSILHPADALDIALARADDENLNKLIDQTIEAFDKQNFLTRGFLAKMPDYQHKFLLEREEKEKLFGPMKPLSFQEHKQIFDETGIDVDGRQALLQHFADSVLVPYYRKVAAYITSLPGVRTLPPEDQHALLKYTKAEIKIGALFPTFNVAHKLYTISEGQVGVVLGYDELLIYHSKDVIDCGLEIAGKLQDLELTDQEYAMVAAVCIVKPEVCVTEEGRDKCQTIRDRMVKALERLLCRRVSNCDAHKVISEVYGFVEMFRDKRNTFNAEWDEMFRQNLHVKWPNFVWDLFTTSVPTFQPV